MGSYESTDEVLDNIDELKEEATETGWLIFDKKEQEWQWVRTKKTWRMQSSFLVFERSTNEEILYNYGYCKYYSCGNFTYNLSERI